MLLLYREETHWKTVALHPGAHSFPIPKCCSCAGCEAPETARVLPLGRLVCGCPNGLSLATPVGATIVERRQAVSQSVSQAERLDSWHPKHVCVSKALEEYRCNGNRLVSWWRRRASATTHPTAHAVTATGTSFCKQESYSCCCTTSRGAQRSAGTLGHGHGHGLVSYIYDTGQYERQQGRWTKRLGLVHRLGQVGQCLLMIETLAHKWIGPFSFQAIARRLGMRVSIRRWADP
jgi:hypothetical protein